MARPGRVSRVSAYVSAGLATGYVAGLVEAIFVNRAGLAFIPFSGLFYSLLFAAGFLALGLLANLIRRDLLALAMGIAVTVFFGLQAGFLLNVRADTAEGSASARTGNLVVAAIGLALGAIVFLATRRRAIGVRAPRAMRWVLLLTLGGLAAFFMVSWRASAPGPNCVLISVDALRADHVGAYGYRRPTTPNLDALARKSTVYLKTYTQSPGTTGGHAAMLTGLYSISSGAYLNGFPLDPKVETLAEVFAKSGYATAAFVNNWYISPALGFGQGFDCFVDGGKAAILRDATPAIFVRGLVLYQVIHRALVPPEAPCDLEVVDAMRWIAWRRNHRFFVFVHILDPHSPYVPPSDLTGSLGGTGNAVDPAYIESLHHKSLKAELTQGEQRILEDRYDEEIMSADRKIGLIIGQLERLGLRDKTLVIVTADHGEVMAESGAKQFGHGTLDYECLHVPLVISFPDRTAGGHRIETVTQTIDITPTVIDVMGLKDSARRQGHSLASPSTREPLTHWTAFATGDIEARDEYAVLTADWQYTILGDQVALNDIRSRGHTAGSFDAQMPAGAGADRERVSHAGVATPALSNLAGQYPAIADSLQTTVEAWIRRCLAEAVVPYSLKGRSVTPGREALDRLKALGYIQ